MNIFSIKFAQGINMGSHYSKTSTLKHDSHSIILTISRAFGRALRMQEVAHCLPLNELHVYFPLRCFHFKHCGCRYAELAASLDRARLLTHEKRGCFKNAQTLIHITSKNVRRTLTRGKFGCQQTQVVVWTVTRTKQTTRWSTGTITAIIVERQQFQRSRHDKLSRRTSSNPSRSFHMPQLRCDSSNWHALDAWPFSSTTKYWSTQASVDFHDAICRFHFGFTCVFVSERFVFDSDFPQRISSCIDGHSIFKLKHCWATVFVYFQ